MSKRKETQKNVTLLKTMCDRLWSKAVLSDWGGKCAVCGKKATEAHHIVPRQFYATRHELTNGIALCQYDHIWNPKVSPHQNAAGWLSWLNTHYAARAEWYMDNRRPVFDGQKNAAYYCGQIRRLRQYVEPEDCERILGVKFSAWLDEQEIDEVPLDTEDDT